MSELDPLDPLDPVDRLVAIEDIKQLKARYCRFVDAQDWAGFRSLFLDGARCVYNSGVFEDPDAMTEAFRELLAGGRTVHHCHLPEIEILGPHEATGTWALFDRGDLPAESGEGSWSGYGRYWETYRRVDGRWYIASLRVERTHLLPRQPD